MGGKVQEICLNTFSLIIFNNIYFYLKYILQWQRDRSVGQKGKAQEICLNMTKPEMLAREAKQKKFVEVHFFNLFLIFSFILDAYITGKEPKMLVREAKHKKFV